MTPTTRSDGLPPEGDDIVAPTVDNTLHILPVERRPEKMIFHRSDDGSTDIRVAPDGVVSLIRGDAALAQAMVQLTYYGPAKPLTEEDLREHLRRAGVPVGDPPSTWKSRIDLVNELLDQAEVARQQAQLTPHNQGLLAKLVPLLGRAASALEIREQGLPIFLGTSERTTNLIGWVKTNDPMITQEVLASSAILPTVVMGGDDRDEPVIVAYGLVLRTMVDTRPNAHLGESDPDDDLKQVVQNLIAAAERFMETADPMPPDGVGRSLELTNAIRDAKRVAS